jgi:MFS family permease
MQMGISTLTKYLQYFIKDCLNMPDSLKASQATSLALLPLLILSPIAALAVGPMMKKGERKSIVYVSGCLMISAAMMGLFSFESYYISFVFTSVFGLGYGPYLSVEYAIIFESLPDIRNSARDMALWHTAMILPDFFTVIAGGIRDFLQGIHTYKCLGYKGVFLLVIVYLVLGTVLTSRLKGIR